MEKMRRKNSKENIVKKENIKMNEVSFPKIQNKNEILKKKEEKINQEKQFKKSKLVKQDKRKKHSKKI